MTMGITERCTQSDFKWSVTRLISIANNFEHVLDIGCGTGRVIKKIRAKKRYGIDACRTVIIKARENNNGVKFICNDLCNAPYHMLPTVQLIYGIDIIEHLEREQALYLLDVIEHKVSDRIILFMPVGNHPQTRDDRGFGNDYYQTHRSTWYPNDMERLGYKVWYYPNWHKDAKPPKEKGAMWCQKIFREA